jgi:hypothetical protein
MGRKKEPPFSGGFDTDADFIPFQSSDEETGPPLEEEEPQSDGLKSKSKKRKREDDDQQSSEPLRPQTASAVPRHPWQKEADYGYLKETARMCFSCDPTANLAFTKKSRTSQSGFLQRKKSTRYVSKWFAISHVRSQTCSHKSKSLPSGVTAQSYIFQMRTHLLLRF